MDKPITIVSGLPRTGTSMMMKMLEAGGLQVMTDAIRKADEDNPGGYYEFERVKRIKEDTSWLEDARGKVFKMVTILLYELPGRYRYKVVFMERDMAEVLASQRKMLERMGKDPGDDAKAAMLYEKHLAEIKGWLGGRDNVEVLYVSYNDMLSAPYENAKKVNAFLGGPLDVDAMVQALDPKLYRNRAAGLRS